MIFQLFANITYAAIHHIRGGDNICTSLSMGQCLFYQCFIGNIIHHIASLLIDNAVLTMASKWVQCYVCDDTQLGHCLLKGAHSSLGQTLRVVGLLGEQ